jgi:hypothetical protein
MTEAQMDRLVFLWTTECCNANTDAEYVQLAQRAAKRDPMLAQISATRVYRETKKYLKEMYESRDWD